ncbi:MAG: hypothetical protein DRI48_00725 [Chloroflexi bacterium]|nr:MAG: hypothetical protein DRI48_00725 [Chloroflexota bacterium]
MSVFAGQRFVDPVGLHQGLDQGQPPEPIQHQPRLTDAEPLVFNGQINHRGAGNDEPDVGISERNRRVIVILLAVTLGGVALTLMGLAFVRGSWWYSYGTDQPLDHRDRARLEAIRDQLDDSGKMPDVVAWLDAALVPNADPSEVRYRLTAAWETLRGADDPALTGVVQDLRAIISAVQGGTIPYVATPTPVPTIDVSAIEWPFD